MGAELIHRAAELQRELAEFARQPRYDSAFGALVGSVGVAPGDELDADSELLVRDVFALEHRLRDGRLVVEQFVDARPELPAADRELVLGWRDVVSGPFEVVGREDAVLVLVNLVDELTYRVATALPTARPGGFVVARLVAAGEWWLVSAPPTVLGRKQRAEAFSTALELALRQPELAFRNPDKLARAWQLQQEQHDRFIRFFGTDMVVVPGEEAQQRIDDFVAFCHAEAVGQVTDGEGAGSPPRTELGPELAAANTVAISSDPVDGLAFTAEFGAVAEAFAAPPLARRPAPGALVLGYLTDDTVDPGIVTRLAERDVQKASALFAELLDRPGFDWERDGEQLLREHKPGYYAHPRQPQISVVGDRLAAFARQA